ncbi:MAG TPA: class I SAM-dependent methyltransferase [Nocardioidaceae bacterium]|nr:class I SAM-dependent methyltransferase [Nocardioidaceae bacterium]
MADYGFDPSWSDERRRLALIEHCYDPMTVARLTELGVDAGSHCLDVGAGRGSIARWMRDRVGPSGRVVAVDLDTRFFDGESGIEARQADILTDELEQGTFDLVHCRLLLHHLRGRQVEAVTRMAHALKPGGILIASECYLGAMRASSTHAFSELWRGLYAAMPHADYEWAVSLPATLQEAGLANVEAHGDVDLVRGGTAVAEFWKLTVEAVRERIPGDIDVDAGLRVLDDPRAYEPSFVWYTAWGTRT